MTQLRPSDTTSPTLQIGQSLIVDARGGAAIVTPINPGAEPGTPVYLTNASQQFGPFEDITVHSVTTRTGTVDVTVNRTTAPHDRPFKRTIRSGEPFAVRVAAGADLTVEGTGYVYDAATLTPLYSVPSVIPAVNYPRVMIAVGSMTVETAWVAAPPGWIGLNGAMIGLGGLAIGLQ